MDGASVLETRGAGGEPGRGIPDRGPLPRSRDSHRARTEGTDSGRLVHRTSSLKEPQNATSPGSATSKRYQQHAARGTPCCSCAATRRRTRQEPLMLLGPATYMERTGSEPMAIIC